MHRFPGLVLALGFCLSWSLIPRAADAAPPDPVDPDPADAAILDQRRDQIVGSDDFLPVRVALLEGRGADAARELEILLGKGENEDLFRMLQATHGSTLSTSPNTSSRGSCPMRGPSKNPRHSRSPRGSFLIQKSRRLLTDLFERSCRWATRNS